MRSLSRSKCILILGSGIHARLAELFKTQAASDLCIITSSDKSQYFDDEKSRKDALIAVLHEHFNPSIEVQSLEHLLKSIADTVKHTHESAIDFASPPTYTPAPFKILDAKSAKLKHKSTERKQNTTFKARPFI